MPRKHNGLETSVTIRPENIDAWRAKKNRSAWINEMLSKERPLVTDFIGQKRKEEESRHERIEKGLRCPNGHIAAGRFGPRKNPTHGTGRCVRQTCEYYSKRDTIRGNGEGTIESQIKADLEEAN